MDGDWRAPLLPPASGVPQQLVLYLHMGLFSDSAPSLLQLPPNLEYL